jgi:hypothetical protein
MSGFKSSKRRSRDFYFALPLIFGPTHLPVDRSQGSREFLGLFLYQTLDSSGIAELFLAYLGFV